MSDGPRVTHGFRCDNPDHARAAAFGAPAASIMESGVCEYGQRHYDDALNVDDQ